MIQTAMETTGRSSPEQVRAARRRLFELHAQAFRRTQRARQPAPRPAPEPALDTSFMSDDTFVFVQRAAAASFDAPQSSV